MTRPLKIALVVDNPAGVLSMQEMLRHSGADHGLQVLESGEEAFEYINALAEALELPPDLLVLDLQWPGEWAFAILAAIGSHSSLSGLPVIVLAELEDESIALEFVALGAQDCLIKSKVDSDSFARAMRYAVTRKRAEEMSRRTITLENELLQEILQHAPICLATFDADLRVSSCNSVFHSQLGMMPDRVLNRRINELLPSTNVQSWQAVVSQNVSFSDPSCVIQRADDGTEFTWDVTAWPITSRQLSLKRAIIVALDVTERIKLERQKEDFFAALAHDIKNPLAGADRLLKLMSAGTAGSDHDKLIDLLKRSNSNVLTMLHNLLDVYRYEASAVPITLRSIDPTQSIVTAIASVSLIAAERNIAVRTDLSDELDVVADSVALQRLLSNLLHNAIQFSEPGSSVQLQARMADSNTVFRIVDSGHGMSQEEQKYLFKRFGHGTNKQLKQGEGTGLGLYLCKQIVDALNGAITCESALGEGTIFTVTLSRLRK